MVRKEDVHSPLHRDRLPTKDSFRPRNIDRLRDGRRTSGNSSNGLGEMREQTSVRRRVQDIEEGLVVEGGVSDVESFVGRFFDDESIDVESSDISNVDV